MSRVVTWRPTASADLIELYDWIASQADRSIAFAYTSRIEERLTALLDFPDQGTPRDDLSPGARTIVYRRRTVIAYRVLDDAIEVLRLAHGGRDLGRLFGDGDE